MPEDAAVALRLLPAPSKQHFAMVVTHDCDCVADPIREPSAEVVIGSIIRKLDGTFTHAKSTRKLHLTLSECGKLIELEIVTKLSVSKEALGRFAPDSAWSMTREEKRILARWLSSRYDRAAFPTALVERLKKIRKPFHAEAQEHGQAAVGIFVDFDPKDELADDNEPYTLEISVVFDETIARAREVCTRLAEALHVVFANAFRRPDGIWDGIELRKCEAVSDTEFTYHEAQSTYVYRLDDLSLNAATPGSLPK